MLGEIHFPNLHNGLKKVHVSMVEIKPRINLWQRLIPLIEQAWRKSLLKFVEFSRPFKIEQWILKVAFDRGMKSIPQIRVARRKVRVDICGIEYSPHILMVHMGVNIRSMVQNISSNPKCREGNFWQD